MKFCTNFCFLMIISASASLPSFAQGHEIEQQPGFLRTGFIYEKASFPSCHASTIEETPSGIVAAWFGGTDERNRDVGIWVSRLVDGSWTAPIEVANGVQYESGGKDHRHPCWNPVLFQPRQGPLLLFYKVGPSPSEWWGMLMQSTDGGKTWDTPRRLPEHIDGPVKNKPIQLPNGDILCGSSTEHEGWRVHFERTADLGKTWQRVGPINDGKKIGAIQPTIVTHADGRLQTLCRNFDGQGQILETWSSDGGTTWSKLSPTTLPNPNSGVDAVTLDDGRLLLVYNHARRGAVFPEGRNVLNVAISQDGITWQAAALLERQPGEYSYPAVIQASDGRVHITYTWRRKKIRHVVLDPAKLKLVEIKNGQWPR